MKNILLISIICLCFFSCNKKHQSQEKIIVQTFKDTLLKRFITEEIRDSILNCVQAKANDAYAPINEQLQFNGYYLIAQLNGFPEYRRKVCREASDKLNYRTRLLTENCIIDIYQDTMQLYTRIRAACMTDSIKIYPISKEASQSIYELSFNRIKLQVMAVKVSEDSIHYSLQNGKKKKDKKLQVIWRNNKFTAIVEDSGL